MSSDRDSGSIGSDDTQSNEEPVQYDNNAEDDFWIILAILNLVRMYFENSSLRNRVHDAPFTGNDIVQHMLSGHYRNCFDSCRLLPDVFVRLASIMRGQGMLRDSRYVSVEEQLRMFLQTIGMGHNNRHVQHNLQHSGETVSRYFNLVLEAFYI